MYQITDPCYGDSGGPLAVWRAGQWQLVGVLEVLSSQLMVLRLLVGVLYIGDSGYGNQSGNGGMANDVAVTGRAKNYAQIIIEISILLQGEGFNCETNETSGDGSWSNVAAQKDWILNQLVPERRTGLQQI